MDIQRICSSYGDYLQYERRFSLLTVSSYLSDIERFINYCKDNGFDPLRVEYRAVRNWVVSLRTAGCSPRTANRKISALRSFYKYLSHTGIIEVNPMVKSALLKESQPLPEVVSEEQMRSLFAPVDIRELPFPEMRDMVMLETLYCTGMRLAELIGLKRFDLDFTQKTISVVGKRKKQRIIPMISPLDEHLQLYDDLRRRSVPDLTSSFFVVNSGRSLYPEMVYRTVRRLLGEVTQQAKRSPHVLRHSFATHLLQHGVPLDAIKELLGHAGLSATQVYTHNSLHTIQNVYNHAHPRA